MSTTGWRLVAATLPPRDSGPMPRSANTSVTSTAVALATAPTTNRSMYRNGAAMLRSLAHPPHLAFAAHARNCWPVSSPRNPARPSAAVGIWLRKTHLVLGVAVCLLATGVEMIARQHYAGR